MTIKDNKKSLVVFLAIFGLFFGAKVSAVTYSQDTTVRFTFNSELSVRLDTADIEILDLTPGTSSDSNTVDISISTNNMVGYTAKASVGDATYNTTNMTHTNGTNAFSSLATDADVASITADNTWGYSTSLDNGSSWSNFSGLPIYTSTAKEIAKTDSPAVDSIKFKINAKAGTSQAAGDYRNVINFTVVANVPPRDFTDVIPANTPLDPETGNPEMQALDRNICELVEAYDTEFRVTDSRDHKNYWISKLRDGKCWMTQNLDLDLVAGKTYTTADTDLGWNGKQYNNASWTATHSTITEVNPDNGRYTGWTMSGNEPYSVDPGKWYWIGNWMQNGESTWYDGWDWYEYQRGRGGDKFSRDPYEGNGEHGHVGNYYNWAAAIADDNADQYEETNGYDGANNSICPKNWQLPHISTYREKELGDNDFYNLRWKYVGHDQNNDDKEYTASPLWFVRSGFIDQYGSITNPGVTAYYWSDTPSSASGGNNRAYSTFVNHSQTSVLNAFNAKEGRSVRCVMRTLGKVTINYDKNGGVGGMTAQKITYGTSAKLADNIFSRSGYVFMGWNTKADGTGVGYGNQEDFYIDMNYDGTPITLYAQWAEVSGGGGSSSYQGRTLQRAFEEAYLYNSGNYDGHKGLYVPVKDSTTGEYTGSYREATSPADYEGIPARDLRFAIQDNALLVDGKTVCERTSVVGSEAYVLDLRDNTSYHIVYAKDGRCWMQDNLMLDIVNAGVQAKMDSTNTNASSTALSYLFNGGGASNDRYATAGVSYGALSPTVPQIGDINHKNDVSSNAMDTANGWKIGLHYNYCAASAGTYCFGEYDGVDTHPDSPIDIDDDICPSGWRLPFGGAGGGEYGSVRTEYGDAGFRSVLHIPLSGSYQGGYYDYAYYSFYWTSTYSTTSYMSRIRVNNSGATDQHGALRGIGSSIRCINKI